LVHRANAIKSALPRKPFCRLPGTPKPPTKTTGSLKLSFRSIQRLICSLPVHRCRRSRSCSCKSSIDISCLASHRSGEIDFSICGNVFVDKSVGADAASSHIEYEAAFACGWEKEEEFVEFDGSAVSSCEWGKIVGWWEDGRWTAEVLSVTACET